MRRLLRSVRPGARFRALVASLLLVLLVPSVAVAASAAQFTVAPKSGSQSIDARPVITVSVYDGYGIKGAAAYSMTLDGKKVAPSLVYAKRGDYRRLKLTYRVKSDLAVGVHRVTVKVTDVKRKASACSWSFTVTSPPPAEMPVTIATSACGACHADYRAVHAMTECARCHGAGAPLGGTLYGPGQSPHTPDCAAGRCHRGGGTFPHVLGSDCTMCHSAAFPSIPQPHGAATADDHVSTSAFCTRPGCHASSLTIEHYKYSVGGRKLSCGTCHASDRAAVVAAIAGRSTACTACHDLEGTVHAGTATAHAKPDLTCTVAACHDGGDIAAIHNGACIDCHAAGRGASTVCGDCHDDRAHPDLAATHAVAKTSCVAVGCHGDDAIAIHDTLRAGGCRACHAPGVARSLVCADCHGAPVAAAHGGADAHHVGTRQDCVAVGCHFGDVTALHAARLGCATCHAEGKLPTTDCIAVGCHAGPVDSATLHPTYGAGHVAPGTGCTVAGCHAANVITIHTTGPTRPGCPACHDPLKPVLTLRCAALGCHPVTPASHRAHTVTIADRVIAIAGTDFGSHACSECHTPLDLITLHGRRCASCHSGTVSAGTLSGGCVQGACHGSGLLAMHATIDAAHALPSAPSCAGTDCHTGGANAAAIHKAQGCRTCHAAGRTATLLCATAGCHSTSDSHPASGPHPNMNASHTGALSVSCVKPGCHVGELTALHTKALGCPTCHRPGLVPTADCGAAPCHARPVDSTALHPTYGTGHTTEATGCTAAGCHPASVIAIHSNGGATAPGCAACHAANKPALTLTCSVVGCHETAGSSHGAHPVTPADQVVSIDGSLLGSHACSECHRPLDLIKLHGGCASCHPGPASGRSIDGGCVQGACHSSGSLAMHATIDAAHTLDATPSCVASDCHGGGTNVAAIHATRGCATCHAAGETPTVVCGTAGCHGGTDSHPASDAHPRMAPGHTTGSPLTCVKAGCHVADLPGLHAGARGCATCHGGGKVPTGDCADAACHPQSVESSTLHPTFGAGHTASGRGCTTAGCHDKNVITIHTTGATRPGCPACHGPMKPALTLECATVGCHPVTPPSHDSHPVAPADLTFTIDGTAFGPHACSECHTPLDLIGLHGGTCASCHTGPGPRAVMNSGCVQGPCHGSGPLAMHGAIDAAHTLASTPSCIATDCHSGGTNVAAIHATGGCRTCHGAGRTATRVCATAGCHSDADSHPVSNAHPSMAEGHTGLTTSCVRAGCHAGDLPALHAKKSGCATCHGGLKIPTRTCYAQGCHPGLTTATHLRYDSAHTLASVPTCVGTDCHGGGSDVRAIHAASHCASCHTPGRPPLTVECASAGCHSAAEAHPAADPHPGMLKAHAAGLSASCVKDGCHAADLPALHAKRLGCATCHGAGKTATEDCGAAGCHPDGGSTLHRSHPSTVTSAAMRINNLNYGTHACTECHPSTDLQAVHGGAASCPKCHPGAADAATSWDGTCTQDACHGPYSGRPMHGNLSAAHLTDTQPTCTNAGCHQGNSTVGGRDVVLMHFAKQGCATCHGGDKTPTLDCISCHAQARTGDHQDAHAVCNTCHAPFVWDPITSTVNQGAQLVDGVHWPLYDSAWTLLVGRAVIRPGYPHGDYTQLVFPAPIGQVGDKCSNCHTGAGKVWVHPGYDYFTCGSGGDCHQHHGNWDPQQDSESYVHNTPPPSWTATMTW
jgi:hypothetical protein